MESVLIINHCPDYWFIASSHVIRRISSIEAVSRKECEKMVEQKKYVNKYYPSVQINLDNPTNTGYFSNVISGGYSGNKCTGVTFSVNDETFQEVYVVYDVKVSISKDKGLLLANENKLLLKSGFRADFTWSESFDPNIGYTYWDNLYDNCKSYAVIFEGLVLKSTEHLDDGEISITFSQTNQTSRQLFMIQTEKKIRSCGIELFTTKNPLLFVAEAIEGKFSLTQNENETDIGDYNMYSNFKIDLAYKNLLTNLKTMFAYIRYKHCIMEQSIVHNRLAISMLAGADGGFELTGQPGFLVKKAGSAMYILKCEARSVMFRHDEVCTEELPVTYDGKNFFMNARTRILQSLPNIIECNDVNPNLFFIGNEWFSLRQSTLIKHEIPMNLEISKINEWKFTELKDIESRGLFTQKQLENNKAAIMYNLEREAVRTHVVKVLENKASFVNNMSIIHGLTLVDIKNLKDSYFSEFYEYIQSKVMFIGNIASFFMGIIYLITFLNEIIFRALILRVAFGCSSKILGACCSSISMALLSKSDIKNAREKRSKKKEIAAEDAKSTSYENNNDQKLYIPYNYTMSEEKKAIK